MFDRFHLFNKRLKVEARLHEFRERMRSKLANEADPIKQAAKFKQERDQALSDGRYEDAAAAHEKLIAIEMLLVGFPEADKP